MIKIKERMCANCESKHWRFIEEDEYGDTYECIYCLTREGRIRLEGKDDEWVYCKYPDTVRDRREKGWEFEQ